MLRGLVLLKMKCKMWPEDLDFILVIYESNSLLLPQYVYFDFNYIKLKKQVWVLYAKRRDSGIQCVDFHTCCQISQLKSHDYVRKIYIIGVAHQRWCVMVKKDSGMCLDSCYLDLHVIVSFVPKKIAFLLLVDRSFTDEIVLWCRRWNTKYAMENLDFILWYMNPATFFQHNTSVWISNTSHWKNTVVSSPEREMRFWDPVCEHVHLLPDFTAHITWFCVENPYYWYCAPEVTCNDWKIPGTFLDPFHVALHGIITIVSVKHAFVLLVVKSVKFDAEIPCVAEGVIQNVFRELWISFWWFMNPTIFYHQTTYVLNPNIPKWQNHWGLPTQRDVILGSSVQICTSAARSYTLCHEILWGESLLLVLHTRGGVHWLEKIQVHSLTFVIGLS